MNCKAVPYEGEDKYIFVSYCHKDAALVYPVIEQLYQEGYRIWYDDGIHPGSEWPEVIAEHLGNCEMCIAFLSENSLLSHNCRKEINFAILKKKNIQVVFLEEVALSPGMEMQLSTIQAVMKGKYNSLKELCHILKSMDGILMTKGEPLEQINQTSGDFSDDSDLDDVEEEQTKKIWAFVHESAEKTVPITVPEFVVGRQESKCNYVILNDKLVSRSHTVFFVDENYLYIKDMESTNKTYVNGIALSKDEKKQLEPGDIVCIGNEKFEIVRIDETEQGEKKKKEVFRFSLYRKATKERIPVTTKKFKIGKSSDKNHYVISDNPKISREHAVIYREEESIAIMDRKSLNHTYVNEVMLKEGEVKKLEHGDQLKFADEIFTLIQNEDK